MEINKNFNKNYQNYSNNNIYTQKEIERAKKKADKNMSKKRGVKGLIVSVCLLSVLTVGLGVWLILAYTLPNGNAELENAYKKSYYEAVSYVDNMDVNLSKALATKDDTALQKYLMTLSVNAELCENNLQQLPLMDESKYYTVKLINQIGDYSKYLAEKLIDGDSLTVEERQSLKELYKGNAQLKSSLQKINEGMNKGYSFSEIVNGKSGDIVLKNFNELQELSLSYPELIYDGPFSDGDTYNNIRGLKGEEVSLQQANGILLNAFKDYSLQEITYTGTTDGDIKAYNFSAKSKGREFDVKIAKNGGNVIMFTLNDQYGESKYNSKECIEKAKVFIESLGYTDMQAVWNTDANGVEAINFVYENNGVLFYPDMVKVNVSHDSLEVTGIECSKYYVNHYERSAESSEIDINTARNSVYEDIEIKSEKKVVIPKGNNAEELAYEFSGEFEGSTYYVFVSAKTGRQVKMFKVIDSTNGQLLI